MWFIRVIRCCVSVSKEDHSDADCLMIAVLTHGFDSGYLYARDTIYSIDSLWLPFTADRCLTLAGKPKIFFVQVRFLSTCLLNPTQCRTFYLSCFCLCLFAGLQGRQSWFRSDFGLAERIRQWNWCWHCGLQASFSFWFLNRVFLPRWWVTPSFLVTTSRWF